ncbi:MAG: hypothetical protein WC759_03205 [Candidatus Micrarchaeia archaeon]
MKAYVLGIILIASLFLLGCCSTFSPPSAASQSGGGIAPSPIDDGSCNSNSDCGSEQRCQSGTCVTVECTSDSDCSGCRRCSDYSCVSCGSGPYGCYC